MTASRSPDPGNMSTPAGRAGPPTPTRRSGRRPGNPDTRQAILDAARRAFAAGGFRGASVRRIAAEAGVDAAMIHHYFGTKEQLFLATVQPPIDPLLLVDRLTDGGLDDLGPRVVRTLLAVWESPDSGPGLVAFLRSALADPERAVLLREFVGDMLLRKVLLPLGVPADEAPIRLGLAMSQIVGLLVGRYVLQMQPVVAVPADVLIAGTGGTLQQYLTGPLAGQSERGGRGHGSNDR